MGANEALTECARAMISRHDKDAAEVAQHFADTHRAIGESEIAAFWTAIAEMIPRMLASGQDARQGEREDEREDARARHWHMQAEKYRAVAEQMNNENARDTCRRMADACDALAKRWEKPAEPADAEKPQGG